MSAQELYEEASRLHWQIVRGESNERPITAWAAVCRTCARASNAKRNELADVAKYGYTRLELNWFNNLERIWWTARAQVETAIMPFANAVESPHFPLHNDYVRPRSQRRDRRAS
jgi:hypothetical protein